MIHQEQIAVQKEFELQKVNSISIEELKYLSECGKSYAINSLKINYLGFEKELFMKEIIGIMKKLLLTSENAQEVIRNLKEIFDSGYKREWFQYETQLIANKERDFKRLERLINYIYFNNYKVYFINFPLKVQINAPLNFKGYSFENISDEVDMIIGKDNERIAVNIMSGEPEYSYRAKLESNKVINSISLITTFLGTYYRFRDFSVKVATWYLKNKDDKGSNLVEQYEHKQGKNIVMHDYSSMNIKDVEQLFLDILGKPELGVEKCSNCLHKSICKMNKKVRVEGTPETNKPTQQVVTASFTSSQQRVVEHTKGPMGVIAVPGAGKTFSLVRRMVALIKSGVEPASILFVTFTNKAAKEIESRVSSILQGSEYGGKMPKISTFNGLGFSILKENPMYVGRRVKLASDVDRLALISSVIGKTPKIENVSYDGMYTEYGLIKQLDKTFKEIDEIGDNEFIEKYSQKKDVVNIMIAYHLFIDSYKRKGFIDYDMQISLVNEMFSKYPHIARNYANKYQYIMVDEFQDSSKDQVDMIYTIAKCHNNIVVVGDDDQSIYRFRGGSNEFMLNFSIDFPAAQIVYMEDNFRSNDLILQSSSALIQVNKVRFNKTFIPHSTSEYKPIYFKGYGIDYMPSLVRNILSKGYSAGDIAIIARNNKRLAELQEELQDTVSLTAPKDYLVEDTVFLALYDVLCLYYKGLDNDISFYRFLGYHNRETLLEKRNSRESFYNNLVVSGKMLPINVKDISCIKKYEERLSESVYMKEGYRLISCFKGIQYAKGIKSALSRIVQLMYGFTEHKVVDALCEMADERAIVTTRELYELMNTMILFNVDSRVGYNISSDSVNLLTAHDAKGKEFKVVIIFAMEDFKEEEEEIRLLYVAQTRAMNTLFMVETPYNHCEVFKYFENEVALKLGA